MESGELVVLDEDFVQLAHAVEVEESPAEEDGGELLNDVLSVIGDGATGRMAGVFDRDGGVGRAEDFPLGVVGIAAGRFELLHVARQAGDYGENGEKGVAV